MKNSRLITKAFWLIVLTKLLLFTQWLSAESADKVVKENPQMSQIYVVNNGWHTGLVVPMDKLEQHLPFLSQDFASARYLEIGWGDFDFYQADDESVALALKALFWPSDSVVHVMGFRSDPMRVFAHIDPISLPVSHTGLNELALFIKESINYEDAGRPAKLKRGLYGNSWFYRGRGSFSINNTCNTWTAKALKKAGVAIENVNVVTAEGVTDQLKP